MPEPKKFKEKQIQTRRVKVERLARPPKMKEKSNQTIPELSQVDPPKPPPKPKMKEKVIQTRAEPMPKQKTVRAVITQTPAPKLQVSELVQTQKQMKEMEVQTKCILNEVKI